MSVGSLFLFFFFSVLMLLEAQLLEALLIEELLLEEKLIEELHSLNHSTVTIGNSEYNFGSTDKSQLLDPIFDLLFASMIFKSFALQCILKLPLLREF